jgi:hypothetical protein
MIKIIYDGQKPYLGWGPNAHKNPDTAIKIKLKLIIGRRPYLIKYRRIEILVEVFTYQPIYRRRLNQPYNHRKRSFVLPIDNQHDHKPLSTKNEILIKKFLFGLSYFFN